MKKDLVIDVSKFNLTNGLTDIVEKFDQIEQKLDFSIPINPKLIEALDRNEKMLKSLSTTSNFGKMFSDSFTKIDESREKLSKVIPVVFPGVDVSRLNDLLFSPTKTGYLNLDFYDDFIKLLGESYPTDDVQDLESQITVGNSPIAENNAEVAPEYFKDIFSTIIQVILGIMINLAMSDTEELKNHIDNSKEEILLEVESSEITTKKGIDQLLTENAKLKSQNIKIEKKLDRLMDQQEKLNELIESQNED